MAQLKEISAMKLSDKDKEAKLKKLQDELHDILAQVQKGEAISSVGKQVAAAVDPNHLKVRYSTTS